MVSARSSWLAAPVLLAIAFLPSLHGSFVWDDAALIQHNAALLHPHGFIAIVTRDLWGQATGVPSQLYHPVPMLSIWLQTLLFGMHIEPLRLANIAIHAFVTWLLVRLLERHAIPRPFALAAGLLVLVHPSVCEPVMWITGRHDTLAMVALFGALAAWPAQERQAHALLRAFGSGIALALAFLSKEPYVIGPLLLGLQLGLFLLQQRRRPSARMLGLFGLALLPLSAAVWLRQRLGISLASAQLHAALSEHARNYASIVWHYGVQLASFQNGATLSRFVPLGIGAAIGVWSLLLLITAVLSGLGLCARGALALALFGWLWFLVSLLPHLVSTPTIGLYGNRYGYCALFGLAITAISLCTLLPTLSARSASWVRFALLLTAAGCALRTGIEASSWRDNQTLFSAAVARDPNNGYALYHLGTAVLSREGCARALPLFVRAAELAPDYERAWHNATGCMINVGRAASALPFAKRSVVLAPFDPRARYNLALAWLGRGERERAIDQLRIALRLNPNDAPATSTLAELTASPEPANQASAAGSRSPER